MLGFSSSHSFCSLKIRTANFLVLPPEIPSPELARSPTQCEEESYIEYNDDLTHLKSNIIPLRIGFNTDFESADLACDEDEKHVESEHDVPIHAGRFSAQTKTDVVTGNDEKFTTSELKTEGEKGMLIIGNQYKKTPARTTSKKNQRSSMTFLVQLLVVILFFMLPRSGAVVVTFPSQPMPDACKAYFDAALTCPKPEIDSYDNVSQICCTHKETKLHCLSSGHEVKICCLAPVTVEKGTFIKIDDHDGSPQMTKHPCDENYFEPKDRQSNQIFHSYCTNHKSVCNPKKLQQLRCHGWTTQDDLCQCMKGHEPDCPTGYDDTDCRCRLAICSNGTERNIRYDSGAENCSTEHEPDLNYTCAHQIEPEIPTDKGESTHDLQYIGFLALLPVLIITAMCIRKYKSFCTGKASKPQSNGVNGRVGGHEAVSML